MNGRIYADEQGLECLLLARSGLFSAVPGTSALPPKADLGKGAQFAGALLSWIKASPCQGL